MRGKSQNEVKVWDPNSALKDHQTDQFLVVAHAAGTFAGALDCSSVRQPSLHVSADPLSRHSYDLSNAISVLVPLGGPVLCTDEMEERSAPEASLFEAAALQSTADFNDIRQDFLPWKSLSLLNIITCGDLTDM